MPRQRDQTVPGGLNAGRAYRRCGCGLLRKTEGDHQSSVMKHETRQDHAPRIRDLDARKPDRTSLRECA